MDSNTPSPKSFLRRAVHGLRQLVPVLLLAVTATCWAQGVRYTYDEAGRLKSVTNAANETAEYVYDAAGNLTAVRRTAAGVPAVTNFTPESGPVGTVVTVSGANFGATPGANTVRFNGTLATVSAASSAQLTVSVPSGATTGPISVQTSAGTGTSVQNFQVGGSAPLGVPTIASFTPSNGLPGSTVTITGTNFNTSAGMTKVYLNQTLATVTSVTSTSITLSVPEAAGSGKFKVTTLAGAVTSAADYVVIPVMNGQQSSYWVPGQLAGVARLVVDGSAASLNVTAPSGSARWFVYLFDRGSSSTATVDFTAFTPTPANQGFDWEVRDVRNEIVTSSSFESSSGLKSTRRSIHIPPMMVSGTYALYVAVPASTSANVTAKFRTDPTLATGGLTAAALSIDPAANPTTAFVGQSRRYAVNGYSTQWLGLGVQGLTLGGNPGVSTSFVVRGQDWQSLTTPGTTSAWLLNCPVQGAQGLGCAGDLPRLTTNGVYSVIVQPAWAYGVTSVSGSLWLSSDLMFGPVTLDTDTNVSGLRMGQNARIRFNANTTDRYGITLSNSTLAPTASNPNLVTELRAADDTPIANTTKWLTAGPGQVASIEYPALPASGTYTVFADPNSGAGGDVRVRVWKTQSGTIAVDGSPVSLVMGAGQRARYIFTLSAAQNLGLGVSGLTYSTSSTTSTTVTVLRSDNSTAASTQCTPASPGSGCQANLIALPAGTYTVLVTAPADVATTNVDLTLSSELTGTLTLGTPYSLTVARRGQNARLTFTASQGDNRRLTFANQTTSPVGGQTVGFVVYAPDGSPTFYTFPSNPTNLSNLQSGPYTIFFDQSAGLTYSLDLTLTQY